MSFSNGWEDESNGGRRRGSCRFFEEGLDNSITGFEEGFDWVEVIGTKLKGIE